MGLFQFRWLRNFIRRNTKEIHQRDATYWKQKLSFTYMVLAWNALGFVAYSVYSGKADWAEEYRPEENKHLTPAQQWTAKLGIKDAKVISISGTNVKRYEVHNKMNENETEIVESNITNVQ